ncbi:hypothetical protein AL01_00150 [Bombella intestini]|uniref:Sulfotransferase n=2 Tax=Bombella TaxID=1654741 RepID=A0A1S8GQV8_9PROT|nr:sulfotransferase [Bombella intestini]OOL19449.1 hypothetical protein AL01_00150 [Bombella intestini]
MSRHVHFISGLPRSGSTLLSVLLGQNPNIYCAEYSTPVCSLMTKMLSVISEGEYKTEFSGEKVMNLLKKTMDTYHDMPSKPNLVIDNNRAWCSKLQLLDYLYPHAKVICCVRDPVWVINSFERIIGRDPTFSSYLVPVEHRATLHQRVNYLLSPAGAFGFAYQALQEAFFGQFSFKLVLVDYDSLVTKPLSVMRFLEKELNVPAATYDMDNVRYTPPTAYDKALETPGLHDIAQKVEPQKHPLILPPDVVNRLAGGAFWRDRSMNPKSVRII